MGPVLTIHNSNASIISGVDYARSLSELDLRGEGEVIGISDTGLDVITVTSAIVSEIRSTTYLAQTALVLTQILATAPMLPPLFWGTGRETQIPRALSPSLHFISTN